MEFYECRVKWKANTKWKKCMYVYMYVKRIHRGEVRDIVPMQTLENYFECVHRGKNTWYLAWYIIPIHTLDNFIKKCPNRRV